MRFGIDLTTQLFAPVEVVWDRNISYWEDFLRKTVPETVDVYGYDTDYAFEERGRLFLPRQVNYTEQTNSYNFKRIEERDIQLNSSRMKKFLIYASSIAIILYTLLISACAKATPTPTPTPSTPTPPPIETPKPTPNVRYAREKSLPYADQLKVLDEDGKQNENEKTFIDLVSAYPEEQAKKIIESLAKGGISDEKIKALNYLSRVSYIYKNQLIEFGLDGDVVPWLNLISAFDRIYANKVISYKLCIQDKKLTELERSFLQSSDTYVKQLFDSYMVEISKKQPELHKELLLLQGFNQPSIDNVEVAEDLVEMSDYKTTGDVSFDALLNEGIKDKRKYCASLEALVWILYDKEKEDLDKTPWKNYPSIVGGGLSTHMYLVAYSWRESIASSNYKSERWKDFVDVTNRLISPELYCLYARNSIGYQKYFGHLYSPKEVFERKKGNCVDQARFATYCLLNSGYEYDNFETNKTNACCGLTVDFDRPFPDGLKGHAVCLYIVDKSFFYIDIGGWINGPFSTINDAAISVAKRFERNVGSYSFVK